MATEGRIRPEKGALVVDPEDIAERINYDAIP
jgi:hypothetical protein